MKTKPSEKSRDVRKIFMRLSHFIGVHLPENSKLNLRLTLLLMMSVNWMVMVITGIIRAYGDTVKVCHALFPASLVIVYYGRAINKFYFNSEERDTILQQKTEDFYEKWESDPKYRKILDQRITESAFFTKLLVLISFIFYHAPALVIDIDNLITGNRMLYIYSILPYIDPDSTVGFVLNSIFLHVCAPIGFVTLIILDCMFVFYGYQTVPRCDMLCMQLNAFGDDLEMSEKLRCSAENFKKMKKAQRNAVESDRNVNEQKSAIPITNRESEKSRLTSIIVDHQNYNLFVQDIIELMRIPCFISVISNSISIGLSIFILFNLSVTLGFVSSCLFLSQVLPPCLMGFLIQTQNEKLFRNLCEFPWYYLCKNEKKTYMEFLHVVQNTADFKLPIVGTLNMQLFTNVINGSYSYFNYFLNFVNN